MGVLEGYHEKQLREVVLEKIVHRQHSNLTSPIRVVFTASMYFPDFGNGPVMREESFL